VQAWHDDAPADEENVWMGHSTHTELLVADTAAEYVPAGQRVQLDAPVEDAYDPAAHAWHVELLLAPAAAEKVPARHCVHEEELFAPTVAE
jgi:hypothetical protein